MEGLGTNEKVLIELLCSRTKEEMIAIKNEYQNAYGKTLESAIIGDTSGLFQRILVSLIQANRDESDHVDPVKANHASLFKTSCGFLIMKKVAGKTITGCYPP